MSCQRSQSRPGLEVLGGEQAGEPGHEARLADDDVGERRLGRLERVVPGPKRGVRSERLDLGPAHRVVGGLAVARAHVVPVMGGERRLEVGDPSGALRRIRDPRHPEHALDERAIGDADVGELLLAVVRLVRQAEPALLEEHAVLLGVAGIVVDEGLEEARDAGPLEAARRRAAATRSSPRCRPRRARRRGVPSRASRCASRRGSSSTGRRPCAPRCPARRPAPLR